MSLLKPVIPHAGKTSIWGLNLLTVAVLSPLLLAPFVASVVSTYWPEPVAVQQAAPHCWDVLVPVREDIQLYQKSIQCDDGTVKSYESFVFKGWYTKQSFLTQEQAVAYWRRRN